MKKLSMILAIAIAMVCFTTTVNAQVSATYNFSATVTPFIAVNLNTFAVPTVTVDPSVNGDAVLNLPSGYPVYRTQLTSNVYSNTPFTVTFAGSSLGTSLPILSRQEGNGGIVDRLKTAISIMTEINGDNGNYPGFERNIMSFVSDPATQGAATGTWTNQTCHFYNAPHDGVVRTDFYLSAALPHATPDFANAHYTWTSADAGDYTFQVVATYTVGI